QRAASSRPWKISIVAALVSADPLSVIALASSGLPRRRSVSSPRTLPPTEMIRPKASAENRVAIGVSPSLRLVYPDCPILSDGRNVSNTKGAGRSVIERPAPQRRTSERLLVWRFHERGLDFQGRFGRRLAVSRVRQLFLRLRHQPSGGRPARERLVDRRPGDNRRRWGSGRRGNRSGRPAVVTEPAIRPWHRQSFRGRSDRQGGGGLGQRRRRRCEGRR